MRRIRSTTPISISQTASIRRSCAAAGFWRLRRPIFWPARGRRKPTGSRPRCTAAAPGDWLTLRPRACACSTGVTADERDEAYGYAERKLTHVADRERGALESVVRLAAGWRPPEAFTASLDAQRTAHASTLLAGFTRLAGRAPTPRPLGVEEREAARLIPRRAARFINERWRQELDLNAMSAEQKAWLDRYMGGLRQAYIRIPEMLNFVDGRRSVLDIRDRVSSEYFDWDQGNEEAGQSEDISLEYRRNPGGRRPSTDATPRDPGVACPGGAAMRRAMALVSGVVLLLAAPAAEAPPVVPRWLTVAVRDELRGKVALDHIYQIATHHRSVGSRGYHEAAAYVAKAAQAAGLQQVETLRFPADGGKTKVLDTYQTNHAWEIRGGEAAIEGETEPFCRYEDIPTCVVEYSSPVDATAELIDVGDGTRADDYAGKNVRGKFVLASGQASSVLALARKKHGAIGVVSAWGNFEPDRSPFPIRSPGRRFPPTSRIPLVGFSVSARTAADLRRRLIARAGSCAREDRRPPIRRRGRGRVRRDPRNDPGP